METQKALKKESIKINKKILIWTIAIIIFVFGISPWIYYFMAGETHPWYPIKISMWEPKISVPEDFVPPEEVYIKDVPYRYISREEYLSSKVRYSGIPATAMVAAFYGDNLSLEEIAKEIPAADWGLPTTSGGGTGNIVKFFEKRGYKAQSYGGSERDLKYHLSLGHPVIIWQFRNPTYIIKKTDSIEQAGHSLHTKVVIGYKKINGQEYFIVHEGGLGTLDVTTGPASKKPIESTGPLSPEYIEKLNLAIEEQEKLRSTLPDYVKVEDPDLLYATSGKNHFVKREDFLAMWQNFIMNPFGLPFTNSPTPVKPNWTVLAYKE